MPTYKPPVLPKSLILKKKAKPVLILTKKPTPPRPKRKRLA